MTELLVGPKAHIHCDPPGTSNLQKLHLLLKYLGRKEAEAKLEEKLSYIWLIYGIYKCVHRHVHLQVFTKTHLYF